MIAFKVPTGRFELAEAKFFRALHCNCEAVSFHFYEGRACYACTEAFREHDHGDEDDSYASANHSMWVGFEPSPNSPYLTERMLDDLSKLPRLAEMMSDYYSFQK